MKKMVLLCLMALAIGIEANAVPIMVKKIGTGIAIVSGKPHTYPYIEDNGNHDEEPVLTEEEKLIKRELGRDTPTALYLLGGMVGFALVMTLLMLYWDGNNMTIQRVKKAWLG